VEAELSVVFGGFDDLEFFEGLDPGLDEGGTVGVIPRKGREGGRTERERRGKCEILLPDNSIRT